VARLAGNGAAAALAQVVQMWSLTVGEPFQPGGQTAWVAPAWTASARDAGARDASGGDGLGAGLVLKIGWPHAEGAHEADGLRAWAGNGAVRLRAAHDFGDATALLLERRQPGTPLSRRPEPEQDTVVAALLRRLWIQPERDHPFPSLPLMCGQWAEEFEQRAGASQVRLDPGLARAGIALFRELPTTATSQVLLCTDLHAGNMLAAAREPWLAIDPKPYVGDPAYDPLQHMLNCGERLRSDPRGLALRMADLLDLDPDRVLLWLFARCVLESPECPSIAAVARSVAP
jgi:streptomycin 6-kinase